MKNLPEICCLHDAMPPGRQESTAAIPMSTIGQEERKVRQQVVKLFREGLGYTIQEHQHRFAAWVAGRAASVKGCRFTVKQAKAILEAVGFDAAFATPSALPKPTEFEFTHRKWRMAVIKAAAKQKLPLKFTHGVAAKLINCYLKVRFVCGGQHEHERVRCLHPPIDEVLLKELARRNVGGFSRQWQKLRQQRWSKFDSAAYQSAIDHIRQSLPSGEPLWKIEEYWEGHQ
jgi:hypothetical protein